MGMPKQGETPTGTDKRPRAEGSTPIERVIPPKVPRDSTGPGTYKEVLINLKISIFKGNYPAEDVQDQILEELGREFCVTLKGELLHEVLQARGACTHICPC
jgi:hypothetical protein